MTTTGYWIVFTTSAYQGPRYATAPLAGDYDAQGEGVMGGFSKYTGGSFVFAESCSDWCRSHGWSATDTDRLYSYVAAHELGHQFGAKHKGANNSIMQSAYFSDASGNLVFAPEAILQIRRYVESPGLRTEEAD